MRPLLAALAGVWLALPAEAAPAESRSVLLERAIYKEETAGDVEAAIRLYREIVAAADADRAVTAQALYRLGSCLERRGRDAEAREVFERLVKDFSDQGDLAHRVRQRLVPRLRPAPWVDGEMLRFATYDRDADRPSSFEDVEIALARPRTWVLRRHHFHPGSGSLFSTSTFREVEVDAETSAPVASVVRGPSTPLQIRYRDGQAVITERGRSTTVDLRAPAFDYAHVVGLLRRLPLAAGYTTSVPVFSRAGGVADARVTVTARETVRVPAGAFDCFAVTLSIGPVHANERIHWISADEHRYPVQEQDGPRRRALIAVDRWDPGAARPFEDPRWGVALTPPPGWLLARSPVRDGETSFAVTLVSPENDVGCRVEFEVESYFGGRHHRTPREVGQATVRSRASSRPSYAVRAGGWSDAPIAGLPAVRYVADFRDTASEEHDVEYGAVIRAQATMAHGSCRVSTTAFDARRADMDALFASVRLP